MATDDTLTLTIESADDSETLAVPEGVAAVLGEAGQSTPEVVADVALIGIAQRVHSVVHHGQEEAGADAEAVEDTTMALFEERFGMTFGEATGHSH
jgi:hypothetical protein